jgi:hypothetical protein
VSPTCRGPLTSWKAAGSSGRPADPALRAELAQAHLRVGNVTRQIGSRAEALGHYEAARSLYAELVTTTPGAAEARAELARILRECGMLRAQVGRPGDAVRAYEEGIAE